MIQGRNGEECVVKAVLDGEPPILDFQKGVSLYIKLLQPSVLDFYICR